MVDVTYTPVDFNPFVDNGQVTGTNPEGLPIGAANAPLTIRKHAAPISDDAGTAAIDYAKTLPPTLAEAGVSYIPMPVGFDPFAGTPTQTYDSLSASHPMFQGDPFIPEATAKPADESWRDKLRGSVQTGLEDFGMPRLTAQDFSDRLAGSALASNGISAADLVPGLGQALAGNEAYRNFGAGNYVGAGLSAVGAIPSARMMQGAGHLAALQGLRSIGKGEADPAIERWISGYGQERPPVAPLFEGGSFVPPGEQSAFRAPSGVGTGGSFSHTPPASVPSAPAAVAPPSGNSADDIIDELTRMLGSNANLASVAAPTVAAVDPALVRSGSRVAQSPFVSGTTQLTEPRWSSTSRGTYNLSVGDPIRGIAGPARSHSAVVDLGPRIGFQTNTPGYVSVTSPTRAEAQEVAERRFHRDLTEHQASLTPSLSNNEIDNLAAILGRPSTATEPIATNTRQMTPAGRLRRDADIYLVGDTVLDQPHWTITPAGDNLLYGSHPEAGVSERAHSRVVPRENGEFTLVGRPPWPSMREYSTEAQARAAAEQRFAMDIDERAPIRAGATPRQSANPDASVPHTRDLLPQSQSMYPAGMDPFVNSNEGLVDRPNWMVNNNGRGASLYATNWTNRPDAIRAGSVPHSTIVPNSDGTWNVYTSGRDMQTLPNEGQARSFAETRFAQDLDARAPIRAGGSSETDRLYAQLTGAPPVSRAPSLPASRITPAIERWIGPQAVPVSQRYTPPPRPLSTFDKHLATLGITPEEFHNRLFAGRHMSAPEVHQGYDGGASISTVIKGDDGERIGTMTRTIYPDHVDHSYFQLQPGARDNGIGKKILASQIPLYQDLGLNEVTVHANIDVGGYAWAKYGFVPSQSSWDNIRSRAGYTINELAQRGSINEATHKDVLDILANRDPKAMWKLSDLREQVPNYSNSGQTELGKRLLLGSDWHGALNLHDVPTMNRFNAYVSQGPRSEKAVTSAHAPQAGGSTSGLDRDAEMQARLVELAQGSRNQGSLPSGSASAIVNPAGVDPVGGQGMAGRDLTREEGQRIYESMLAQNNPITDADRELLRKLGVEEPETVPVSGTDRFHNPEFVQTSHYSTNYGWFDHGNGIYSLQARKNPEAYYGANVMATVSPTDEGFELRAGHETHPVAKEYRFHSSLTDALDAGDAYLGRNADELIE